MWRLSVLLLPFLHWTTPQRSSSSRSGSRSGSSSHTDVRWLQFVNQFQTRLTQNSSISSVPMCTTWLSNNHQTTRSLNRTLENLEKWGKHCVSDVDCLSGQLSFQNQGLNIIQQLDAGVRRLVLELHYVPGAKRNLRLCASLQVECTAMKRKLKVKVRSSKRRRGSFNWCKSFQMNTKGPHTGCHSGSPEFKDTVRDISRWLNRNQDEFVIIDLIDYVSTDTGCVVVPELETSLKLFGSRLLKPSQLENDNRTDDKMPLLVELKELRKNLLVRSTCTFGGNLIFPARATDYVSIDEFNTHACNAERAPFTLFYHDKIHVDLTLSARKKLRHYRTLRTPTRLDLQQAARCNSQIALQATRYSDLFGCSWTWLPHHDNQNCSGCTAFYLNPDTMTYGWVNTECDKTLHLACRDDEGEFGVSRRFHHLPNNGDVHVCGAAHLFALPLTPREAYSLAASMLHHGLSHVWLPRIESYTCTTVVQDIQCGEPEVPQNGSLLGSERGFDALVRYQCDTGYTLEGEDTSQCQSNGSWSGHTPSCRRVDCGEPPRPERGRAYGTNTDYGSMWGYTCNWGHVFEGQASIDTIVTTCLGNGQWDVIVPDCIRRQCEVSEWGDWGECSATCEGGTQTRTRHVTSHINEINGNCPALSESRTCNERKCDTCTTRVYRTIIEADQCKSAVKVTNKYCSGLCREEGMCCRPTVRTTRDILLFCEDSPPRTFTLPVIEECGCVPCGG